jgi:acylphosphatase
MPPSNTDCARAHVKLSGRVQGVGFRYATVDAARERGLAGWVRNLDSGDVEAVFEGAPPAVEDMLRWCHEGPPGSFVQQVQVTRDEPLEGLTDFQIRRTAFSA